MLINVQQDATIHSINKYYYYDCHRVKTQLQLNKYYYYYYYR